MRYVWPLTKRDFLEYFCAKLAGSLHPRGSEPLGEILAGIEHTGFTVLAGIPTISETFQPVNKRCRPQRYAVGRAMWNYSRLAGERI